jgi:hypothetical protein
MFVMEAATAIAPRIVESSDFCSPVIVIEATIAIAEIAFVRDMSGVWRSGVTRRITSSPRNVARRKTKRFDARSVVIASSASFAAAQPVARRSELPQGQDHEGYLRDATISRMGFAHSAIR